MLRTSPRLLRGIFDFPNIKIGNDSPLNWEKAEQYQSHFSDRGIYKDYLKVLRNLDNETPRIKEVSPIIGIEVEAEGLNPSWSRWISPVWNWSSDGSLKDAGAEFISKPLHTSNARDALVLLWACFQTMQSPPPYFRWRSSIHVHVNMQNRNHHHLLKFLLTYSIFEEDFFSFVGEDRKQSIFCVPLHSTRLDDAIFNSLSEELEVTLMAHAWDKYSALNLKPLFDKGTVEFRHMGGTNDLTKIVNWISLIVKLDAFAAKIDNDALYDSITTLNTNSLYEVFKEEVFGPETKLLLSNSNSANHMSNGVKFAKKCLHPPVSHLDSATESNSSIVPYLLSKGTKKVITKRKIPGKYAIWPEFPVNFNSGEWITSPATGPINIANNNTIIIEDDLDHDLHQDNEETE